MACVLGIAVGLDLLAVLAGAIGYRYLEGMGWLDACVTAGMVITSNGPIRPLQTNAGKIFSLFDAILGGIVFVTVLAVLLTPVFHRILHTFHLEIDKGEKKRES